MKIKEYIDKIPPQFRNRYVLVTVFFFIWMTFFDLSRFPRLWEKSAERESLLEETADLEQKIKDNYQTLELLEDSIYLDKFAREKYMMKKAKEDLFVIVDSTRVED